jgi:hypothetical protein
MGGESTGRYQIFDIDAAALTGDLLLSPGDAGAAVLVRREGIPIGFWMQEVTGYRRVPAGEVAQRVTAYTTEAIAAAHASCGQTCPSQQSSRSL